MATYHQPDFYKFGHDSLELVDFIVKRKTDYDRFFLEVGTGCGVMSIELALKFPDISIDALEPLSEFTPFIIENIKTFGVKNIMLSSVGLEDYYPQRNRTFDIIFFNPPYFWEEKSRPSPNQLRDRCRRMKKENFVSWMAKIEGLIKANGKVFLTYRSKEVEELIRKSKNWEIQEISETSGSYLLFLKKRL